MINFIRLILILIPVYPDLVLMCVKHPHVFGIKFIIQKSVYLLD